jgi:glycosyltransferase involved in cell wall biosynthesis/GT2 family glycosyltransferase
MAFVARQSISVVFPAYNEEENIARAVEQAVSFLELLFTDWEVIVVDDGSRDKTVQIVDALARRDPRIVALHHPRNRGYGAALRSGIQAARKDLVFFCDSDLQFHITELLLLLAWIEQYDLVIGYRGRRMDAVHRKVNAWGWRTLVRLLLGLSVRDIDCAFKLFRRDVFKYISIESVGAMVNTEILVQAVRMGFKIKEVPVTHFPRTRGTQTGANLRVIAKAFRELFRLYFKLRDVKQIVFAYDRRQSHRETDSHPERRQADRRKVMLPINFPDRRRRIVRLPGAEPAGIAAGRESGRGTKVAMVVASPFPADHGTPGSIKEMAEALVERGHAVHVVTYHFGEGPPPKDVRIHRVPDLGFARRVSVGPSLQKPVLDLLLAWKLIRVVLAEGIDVIHAHNYEGQLAGFVARLVTRRPLVYNAVNTMIDELPTYRFFRPRGLAVGLAKLLDHWVPRTADHIIAISDDLAAFLHGRGIPADRITTIPLGVRCEQFEGHDGAEFRARYGLETNPLVAYTGTLDRFQRIDYLMKAMRLVADQVEDARLFVGTNVVKGADLLECRRLADDLGLRDRVIVTETPFAEVPKALAAADVVVVSRPNCPGFPVKLLNYMAAARPIVVFEGSAKGLEHLKQAVVPRDHDWEAMGHGIVSLLQDRELAAELARNARRWVDEQLSWRALTAKTEAVYAKLARTEAASDDVQAVMGGRH